MKILAIGNSFSQDATRYIQDIAKSAGIELFVRNLYIGGCSLERHAHNVKTGVEAYSYEENAVGTRMISVGEALELEKWDVVTVQQVSGQSGIAESYEPYITELLDFIKEKAPQARIVFHRTWAYEKGSAHGDFPRYDCDRKKMLDCIIAASTEVAAKKHGLDMIPSGNVIGKANLMPEFDSEKGGVSLYRDGFHLSLTYGRYLAGLVWFKFFTDESCDKVTYSPDGTDEKLISILKSIV